ncbi:hypothetical protein [Gilvimarinus algae]|uniref:Solute-binding protein family 3/N-terminal domain-containing protein n=1 Tax=Gilvimarinus algae TaxID=3058037 RepID=A0ABT8TIN3_9GAMM|nr:hypothetical protein [Gilvimarinus sp. SDUM040014]MDO3383440.1 hypothetical protein [Gilvimarinus sp. SDUM040014]
MAKRAIALTTLLTLLTLCGVTQPSEPQVFTYRTPSSSADHRFSYEVELLRLALERTVPEYGPFQLQPGFSMNLPRAMAIARANALENLVIKTSYSDTLAEEFDYPPYPIDRGIFSYRICFVNNAKRQSVAKADSLEQMRAFTIGQGVGWLDVEILRYNGLTVTESPSYESLFPMLAAGRLDLVCRAQNEVAIEWEHFGALGGFSIDDSFAFYYPLPRFFWVHKSNPLAFQRLSKGLEIIYRDGTALELWKKYYEASLAKVTLTDRRIYVLKNPYLKHINPAYKDFFLNREATQLIEKSD